MFIQFSIIAIVGALVGSALAAGINGRPEEGVAKFYSDKHHQGTEVRLTSNGQCVNLPSNINDEASSINTENTCMEVFAHRDCSGPSRYYFPDKNGGTHGDMHADGFGDVTSSVKKCDKFGRKLE